MKLKLRDRIKEALKRGEHVGAKLSLFASRGAFLMANKLNLFHIAKRMKQAHEKHPEAVEKFWYKFGGEWKNLLPEIEKGIKHAEKHKAKKDARYKKKHHIGDISCLGEPYTAATVIAVATPILAAVTSLFKKLKTDKKGDDVFDKKNLQLLAKRITEGGAKGIKVVSTDKQGKETILDHGKPETNNGLMIGAGAAILVGGYFLMKKK